MSVWHDGCSLLRLPLTVLYHTYDVLACYDHINLFSKSDVFASGLMSAIEKRQLMKFLQFVHDWGQHTAGQVRHVYMYMY